MEVQTRNFNRYMCSCGGMLTFAIKIKGMRK
jgi:hypothetical protein